ncbi:MDR family NADP-dependent oxidoreductase [Streptomyces boninensis]|uniref:MDR family NADP-dependent oxidoreductase n=1 Tax=Streptomyces boninensis TaxID=2039455 RepID=UPI003B21BEB8
MPVALPRTAREVRLATAPRGLPTAAELTITETPVPQPGPGEVLVRNTHFLVFPGLRTLISGAAGDDVPLPALKPGDPLLGTAVGEVAAAGPGSRLHPGTAVTHFLGWREYALLPESACTVLDDTLPDPVAHLAQGAAPYASLTRLAPVRNDDVVLVTGAGGAVGTLAGQIARLLGAGRVIGVTGSAAKANRLTTEAGYDAIIRRDQPDLDAQLTGAAPQGIDILLDTTGGPLLATALRAARQDARFALVGAASGQLDAARGGADAPVELDSFRIVIKGLTIRGFSATDLPAVEGEWRRRFGAWLRAGEIRFPYTAVPGINAAPAALEEVMAGRPFGALVVEV